ncbi:MAG: hypothetical protein ACN2B6_11885 [Rickettsiales bacterium]
MPSLKQMLEDAGITLPEGFDLNSAVESSDEVAGLKTKRDELLSWQSENKPVLDSLKQKQAELEEANRKALEEKEQLAIQNKDYETLSQINADKLKQFEERDKRRNDALLSSAREAAISDVANLFSDKMLGKDIGATKVEVSLNEDGDPVKTFKLGDQTFGDIDEFSKALSDIPSYSSAMAAPMSKTAPASGGESSGGKPGNAKANAAAKNGDSLGYLNAALSGEN